MEQARTLIEKKSNIEAQIEAQISILKANDSTMQTPLVDTDGFPRADIDVYAVRSARVRIIELRNDLNAVTNDIAKALETIYNPANAPKDPQPDSSSAELRPFAKVNTVAPQSPAAEAGLQRDDLVLKFGPLDHRTCSSSLQPLTEVVSANENWSKAIPWSTLPMDLKPPFIAGYFRQMVTPQPIPVSESESTSQARSTDSEKPRMLNESVHVNSSLVPATSHRAIQESLESVKKVLTGHGHYGDIHLVSHFDNQGLAQGFLIETVILTYKKSVIGKSCANAIAAFFTHDCALLIRSGPNTQEDYFPHKHPPPTLDSIVSACQSDSAGRITGNRGSPGCLCVSSTDDVNRGTTEDGHREFVQGQNTSSGEGSGRDHQDNRGSHNNSSIDGEGDRDADERSGFGGGSGSGGGSGGGNTGYSQEFKLAFTSSVAVRDDKNQKTLFSFTTSGLLSLQVGCAVQVISLPGNPPSFSSGPCLLPTFHSISSYCTSELITDTPTQPEVQLKEDEPQSYDLPRRTCIEENIETSKERTDSFKATLSFPTPALEGGGSIHHRTARNTHHPLPLFEVIPQPIVSIPGTENESWTGTSWRYSPWCPCVTTVFALTQETVPWILFAYLSQTPMGLDNTFQARIISTWVPTKEASLDGFFSIIHVTVLSIPLSALGAMNEGHCDGIQTSASVVKEELKSMGPPTQTDYSSTLSSSVSEAGVWNASTALYAVLSPPPSLGSQVYQKMQRIIKKFRKNKV
ncbi:hypothetical protein C0995_006606 [Termitomyces sp. Mi166|nr:hypothetical protein C0995_006606 [Termitomyces sp. Mi166\